MGTMWLTRAEKKLCRHVAHGDRAILDPNDKIRAEVVRHIMLALPLMRQGGSGSATGSRRGLSSSREICVKTSVGIRMTGGIIDGRLKLDAAVGEDGGPMCPLEFENTWFDGGFSGANSRFGRLSFRNCRFNDRPPEPPEVSDQAGPPACQSRALPTIELSGAMIDSDLDLQGVKPRGADGLEPEEGKLPFLWIRALGVRVAGNLDLSGAYLKAPDDDSSARPMTDPPVQPLNLSLARIEGDFTFLGGATADGQISARSACIGGDIWMSGATIVARAGDKRALFLQLATVGGAVMLDGRNECADGRSGDFRPFKAVGEVNLFAARLGGSLVLNDVDLRSKSGSEEDLCLCLTAARIRERLEIGRRRGTQPSTIFGRIRLDRLEVGTIVEIENILLGCVSEPKAVRHCIDARALCARHLSIRKVQAASIPPEAGGGGANRACLSMTLENARLERLSIQQSVFNGALDAPPLHCGGNVVLDARFVERVNLEGSTIGGSLDISALRVAGAGACLGLRDATIGRALRLVPRDSTSEHSFRLGGEDAKADLTGLSCDTLDDDVGQRWGKHVLVDMNHFTYRRTGWATAHAEKSEQSDRKAPKSEKSFRKVSDWVQARCADGRLPWRWYPRRLLSKSENFWEPWQLRRNWIYQQYRSDAAREASADPFVSPSRHRIHEQEYRPQPFEQAIEVARAEGREDSATQFEIHKQRLEWIIFNRRVRWPLGIVAIILAALWLIYQSPAAGDWLVAGALVLTLALMIGGSLVCDAVQKWIIEPIQLPTPKLDLTVAVSVLVATAMARIMDNLWFVAGAVGCLITVLAVYVGSHSFAHWHRPRPADLRAEVRRRASRVLTWLIYWLPALALLLLGDWDEAPFHFFVAFLIFSTIRLLGVLAHAVMRLGFGYLRRPILAITTLILAFLVGWGGVAVAAWRDMFVIAVEPSAGLAATVDPTSSIAGGQAPRADAGPETATGGHDQAVPGEGRAVLLMGSEAAEPKALVRDVSCSHEISQPLYALDVLIPIIDLGEERRCEIRRFPVPGREWIEPSDMSIGELARSVPALPLDDNRFWWWMKALYAVAGWILVSLAILTFAQAHKARVGPQR